MSEGARGLRVIAHARVPLAILHGDGGSRTTVRSRRRRSLKLGRSLDDFRSMPSRMLKLRWPATCRACGSELPAGSWAQWDSATHAVTCGACQLLGPDAAKPVARATPLARATPRGRATPEGRATPAGRELDRGHAGASVAREYERRRHNREVRTREAHPRIGGLLLALRGAPQHEAAFHQGELGEKAVAESLERRTAGRSVVILHDRRMPRGRGNIDHLAIAPAGVFVIDAKNINGKVRVHDPLFGAPKLLVGGRDRTNLIDGLDRQVSAVRGALATHGHAEVPVRGVLCFTTADLPLLGAPKIRGHYLLYRRALAKKLNQRGPFDPSAIDALAEALVLAFPSA